MAGDVVIDDRVWRKLKKKLAKAVNSHVKVGVLAAKGGGEDHDGITITDLAAIHEFGSDAAGIPERSFIRRTFITKEKDVARMSAKLAKGLLADKFSLRKALDLLGLFGATEVKKTITAGSHIPPKLADVTIEKRRRKSDNITSDRPLVDTGRLVQSIQWEVVLKS